MYAFLGYSFLHLYVLGWEQKHEYILYDGKFIILFGGKFLFDEPEGLKEKLNCHYAMQRW